MFCGAWLQVAVEVWIRRNRTKRDGWPYWRVVLTRARYGDDAQVDVRFDFYLAHRWRHARRMDLARKKKVRDASQFSHAVFLGNLNNAGDRARIRTIERSNRPDIDEQIAVELLRIAEKVWAKSELWAEHRGPIDTMFLRLAVEEVCLTPKVRAAG